MGSRWFITNFLSLTVNAYIRWYIIHDDKKYCKPSNATERKHFRENGWKTKKVWGALDQPKAPINVPIIYIYIRHRSNLFLHVNKNNANVQMERNRKDKCWVFSFHSWLISKGVSYYSYSSKETELN